MKPTRFESAIALIDKKNSEDPNVYRAHGLEYPKELLYSQDMTRKLLQIAARAQHIFS